MARWQRRFVRCYNGIIGSLDWKYLPAFVAVALALLNLPGADVAEWHRKMYVVIFVPLVFCTIAYIGYKPQWSILILGDKASTERFTEFVIPELEPLLPSHRVIISTDIADKNPCDTVILTFDLKSLRDRTIDLTRKQRLVDHYGQSIYRHIIVVLLCQEVKPDSVVDYIDEHSPEEFKDLLKMCDNRWVLLRVYNDMVVEDEIKCLKRCIDNVTAENCGPFKHRIILLGGRDSKKYSIGNVLLGNNAFGEAEPGECVTIEGVVSGQRILLVNTPAVQTETANDASSDNHMQIGESLLLTSPGPRVYVLVVNESEMDSDISACAKVFKKRFGKEAYSHLIVVYTCQRNRQNNSKVLHQIKQKASGFITNHVNTVDLQKEIMDLAKRVNVQKKELSLVLVGCSRIGKSHTANNILNIRDGEHVFDTRNRQGDSITQVSVAIRVIGENEVLVADTPSLKHLNDEEFKEIEKCIFLPDKTLRPIVVVLRCDQTPGEEELRLIEYIRNHLPEDHIEKLIFLFTRKDFLLCNNDDFKTFLKGIRRGPLRETLSACHWRCIAVKNKSKDRQLDSASRLDQNDILTELVKRVMNPNPPLQMVLLGHTGSGKSASGNTIISTATGRDDQRFNASLRQVSNTEECQVADINIAGRTARLVDTPGLFDTRPQYNNNTTMRELTKCLLYTIPGPHAFLVVFDVTRRRTPEIRDSLQILKQAFGEEMFRHTIIIFTHIDELRGGARNIGHIIAEINERNDTGKEFVRKSASYVTFDNRQEGRTGNEAVNLLEEVEIMLAVNEHRRFTNKVYDNLLREINWYGTGYAQTWRYHAGRNPMKAIGVVGMFAGAAVGVAVGSELLIPATAISAAMTYITKQWIP